MVVEYEYHQSTRSGSVIQFPDNDSEEPGTNSSRSLSSLFSSASGGSCQESIDGSAVTDASNTRSENDNTNTHQTLETINGPSSQRNLSAYRNYQNRSTNWSFSSRNSSRHSGRKNRDRTGSDGNASIYGQCIDLTAPSPFLFGDASAMSAYSSSSGSYSYGYEFEDKDKDGRDYEADAESGGNRKPEASEADPVADIMGTTIAQIASRTSSIRSQSKYSIEVDGSPPLINFSPVLIRKIIYICIGLSLLITMGVLISTLQNEYQSEGNGSDTDGGFRNETDSKIPRGSRRDWIINFSVEIGSRAGTISPKLRPELELGSQRANPLILAARGSPNQVTFSRQELEGLRNGTLMTLNGIGEQEPLHHPMRYPLEEDGSDMQWEESVEIGVGDAMSIGDLQFLDDATIVFKKDAQDMVLLFEYDAVSSGEASPVRFVRTVADQVAYHRKYDAGEKDWAINPEDGTISPKLYPQFVLGFGTAALQLCEKGSDNVLMFHEHDLVALTTGNPTSLVSTTGDVVGIGEYEGKDDGGKNWVSVPSTVTRTDALTFPSQAPSSSEWQCIDEDVCCFWACSNLILSTDREIVHKGNTPDIYGVFHPELHLTEINYTVLGSGYSYDDPNGPLRPKGENKNMFQRCSRACFSSQFVQFRYIDGNHLSVYGTALPGVGHVALEVAKWGIRHGGAVHFASHS